MKRADSIPILQFIRNVDAENIVGQPNSSGPSVLQYTRDALASILDGADPDKALDITRTKGRAGEPVMLALALAIHQWRENGDTWDTIEKAAAAWLKRAGEKPRKRSTLVEIYKTHRSKVERIVSVNELVAFFNAQQSGNSS